MNYAMIDDGVVSNMIWLNEENAAEFPSAVPIGDRPVRIGDAYENGAFYHDGNAVLTPYEALHVAQEAIAELDSALLDAEYNNIIGGMA